MSKAKKPRLSIDRAIYYGKEALLMAKEHKADIEARLDAGTLDGLQSDIPQLEAMETGRPAKVTEVKGLTGSQVDIAEKGHGWVMAVRKAVKDRAEGSGLAKAVGVGLPAKPAQAKTVATAIEAVLTAAAERPAELRACGVLDKDLAKGQAILASLTGARSTQDDGMGKKKDLTALKNAIQLRVETAVSAIGTAGNLEYQDTDAALARRFLDLIPSNGGDDGPPPPPEPPKA
jgi:hypothetical protein